ncbi:MAG TPA: hypothetical protein VK961_28775, partial [Chthoniobacter sp.]|nr:hypothetical protein [Chthoniobacter sp.]
MKGPAQKRALTTCIALAGCFTVFSYRLIDLQVTKHDEYAQIAANNHVTRQTIPARRGIITDIRGEALAQNEPVRTVVADATLITDRDAVAEIISKTLNIPHPQVMEKLTRVVYSQALKKEMPSPYIVLKKEVPVNLASDI